LEGSQPAIGVRRWRLSKKGKKHKIFFGTQPKKNTARAG